MAFNENQRLVNISIGRFEQLVRDEEHIRQLKRLYEQTPTNQLQKVDIEGIFGWGDDDCGLPFTMPDLFPDDEPDRGYME